MRRATVERSGTNHGRWVHPSLIDSTFIAEHWVHSLLSTRSTVFTGGSGDCGGGAVSEITMDFVFKMMDFELKMMDFVFKMMKFVFKMMDFELQMMDFVFKMMDFGRGIASVGRTIAGVSLSCTAAFKQTVWEKQHMHKWRCWKRIPLGNHDCSTISLS